MYKIDHKLKIKSEDLIWHVHNYDFDPISSHIYLFGREEPAIGSDPSTIVEPGVEYTLANRFIRNINLCMRAKPDSPILIHMKTNGGHWEEGMAIYNSIKACPVKVTILNYTHARSMSSLIFLSANKRVMMQDSTFMFHDGTFGIEGTKKQVESAVDFNKVADARMMQIYIDALKVKGKFSSWSREKIEKMLRSLMDRKEDVYLTAKEAVEWGFADAIFGEGELGYNWAKLVEFQEHE